MSTQPWCVCVCARACLPTSPLNPHSFLVTILLLSLLTTRLFRSVLMCYLCFSSPGPLRSGCGLLAIALKPPLEVTNDSAEQRSTLTSCHVSAAANCPPLPAPSQTGPLSDTRVCQHLCSVWQIEDTKSTLAKMNDYFPNDSSSWSISGLLRERPVMIINLVVGGWPCQYQSLHFYCPIINRSLFSHI